MKTIKMNRTIRGGAAALALAGVSMGFASTSAQAADGATWDRLAQCESGGNWNINTGNGFFGGLQFTQQSWNGVGMAGSPQFASREQQIEAGERLLAIQGWGAWPACSAKLGLYGNGGGAAYKPAPVAAPVAPAAPAAPAYVAPAAPAAPAYVAPVAQAPVAAPAAPMAAPAAPVAQAPVAAQAAPAAPAAQAPAAVDGTFEYTIQAGDTLSELAEKFNVEGGWPALFELNKDTVIHQDLIITGHTLRIPAGK